MQQLPRCAIRAADQTDIGHRQIKSLRIASEYASCHVFHAKGRVHHTDKGAQPLRLRRDGFAIAIDRQGQHQAGLRSGLLHQREWRGCRRRTARPSALDRATAFSFTEKIETERGFIAAHRFDEFDHEVLGPLAFRPNRESRIALAIDAAIRAHGIDKGSTLAGRNMPGEADNLNAWMTPLEFKARDITAKLVAIHFV